MSDKCTKGEKVQSTSLVGYSWQIGFVYVFNLIVGAGLLALPKAFGETGWLLGMVCLIILALISYMTVTFTVEAMAISNAFLRYKAEEKARNAISDGKKPNEIGKVDKEKHAKDNCAEYCVMANPNTYGCDTAVDPPQRVTDSKPNMDAPGEKECDDTTDKRSQIVGFKSKGDVVMVKREVKPVLKLEEKRDNEQDLYDITVNVELGEMSKMFFYKAGVVLYYVSVCLYLYGGLSIYAAAISKSLTTVVCGDAKCFEEDASLPCKNVTKISVHYMYRIMLAVFVLLICPFAYFRITNTKVLQIFTTTYRWLSMIAMIGLAFVKIGKGKVVSSPRLFSFDSLPNFFGVAIYSFMCQHSIPAVLTPVRNTRRISILVILDFLSVIAFYATILMSAVFAFPQSDIQDLYTLNFTSPTFFKYLLQLFPVFTLSANFPILAIVLGDNMKKLILASSKKDYGFFLNRILFPTIVIVPPIAVAYSTSNVGMLVGFTGTYAGAILQYVIPSMLVFCGRRQMIRVFGVYENKHRSPFRHNFWIILVMAWYFVCLVFVTYNKIKRK